MSPPCRLAEKIRAARVNKERALQLQEKAQLAAQEAEYNKVYDTVRVQGGRQLQGAAMLVSHSCLVARIVNLSLIYRREVHACAGVAGLRLHFDVPQATVCCIGLHVNACRS